MQTGDTAPYLATTETIGTLVTARDAEQARGKLRRNTLLTGSDTIERFTRDHVIVARVLHLLFDPSEDSDRVRQVVSPHMDHWQVRLYRDSHVFDTMFHTGKPKERRPDGSYEPTPLPTPGCVMESLLDDARTVEEYTGLPLPWVEMAADFDMDRTRALRAWETMVVQRERLMAFLGDLMVPAMALAEEV